MCDISRIVLAPVLSDNRAEMKSTEFLDAESKHETINPVNAISRQTARVPDATAG